jgi:prevent-host-death family protein
MKIPIEQAQRELLKLVEQVVSGEEMVITRDGRPVARLVPDHGAAPSRKADRQPGSAKGEILSVSPDFDAPLDEFREYMG